LLTTIKILDSEVPGWPEKASIRLGVYPKERDAHTTAKMEKYSLVLALNLWPQWLQQQHPAPSGRLNILYNFIGDRKMLNKGKSVKGGVELSSGIIDDSCKKYVKDGLFLLPDHFLFSHFLEKFLEDEVDVSSLVATGMWHKTSFSEYMSVFYSSGLQRCIMNNRSLVRKRKARKPPPPPGYDSPVLPEDEDDTADGDKKPSAKKKKTKTGLGGGKAKKDVKKKEEKKEDSEEEEDEDASEDEFDFYMPLPVPQKFKAFVETLPSRKPKDPSVLEILKCIIDRGQLKKLQLGQSKDGDDIVDNVYKELNVEMGSVLDFLVMEFLTENEGMDALQENLKRKFHSMYSELKMSKGLSKISKKDIDNLKPKEPVRGHQSFWSLSLSHLVLIQNSLLEACIVQWIMLSWMSVGRRI